MEVEELRESVLRAPVSSQADLERMLLYVTAGSNFLPGFEVYGQGAKGYQDYFNNLFDDPAQKNTLVWADWARFSRRNWLDFFQPLLRIDNLRMKTDGLPIQMGSGVVLAPTGSRDNIASLYVFQNGAFNRKAADFVTSLAGRFTLCDYDFFGVYGLYKYRGSVILEEWDKEADPVHNPQG